MSTTGNRLVANSLESRWNEALRIMGKLEEECERLIAEYKNDPALRKS
jgi:hypothetical protein